MDPHFCSYKMEKSKHDQAFKDTSRFLQLEPGSWIIQLRWAFLLSSLPNCKCSGFITGKFVDRVDYQYVYMDTESVCTGLSGPLFEIINFPWEESSYLSNGSGFLRRACDQHNQAFIDSGIAISLWVQQNCWCVVTNNARTLQKRVQGNRICCQAMERVLHYMCLESQLCQGVLTQETSMEKNSLMGWLLCLKSVIVYG